MDKLPVMHLLDNKMEKNICDSSLMTGVQNVSPKLITKCVYVHKHREKKGNYAFILKFSLACVFTPHFFLFFILLNKQTQSL